MKKVLILAYDFPPYISVGGLRPFNWLQYLKEFDIEPIIITRQWDNKHGNELDYIEKSKSEITEIEHSDYGTIIKTPYQPNLANKILLRYGDKRFRLFRKLISFYYEIIQFLWISGPKKNLYIEAEKYLKSNSVDLIIASGDPFVLFSYASKLSTKNNIPWIADYRDPWSFDLIQKKNSLIQRWELYLEKKILKSATFITTVNQTFAQEIAKINKKRIEIISNGYDPTIIDSLPRKTPKNKVLTIGFVGTMYEWHPIDSFLMVINQFITQHGLNSIKIAFYGVNNRQEIQSIIDSKYPLINSTIEITPRMSNKKVLHLLSESDMLLLFNYYSIIGTKIYDYIGVKRPILFCFSEDENANALYQNSLSKTHRFSNSNVQEELIKKSNSGYIVKNTLHLLEVLNERYTEFQKTGQVKCNTNDSEDYSRRTQTKKLAQLIKEITN